MKKVILHSSLLALFAAAGCRNDSLDVRAHRSNSPESANTSGEFRVLEDDEDHEEGASLSLAGCPDGTHPLLRVFAPTSNDSDELQTIFRAESSTCVDIAPAYVSSFEAVFKEIGPMFNRAFLQKLWGTFGIPTIKFTIKEVAGFEPTATCEGKVQLGLLIANQPFGENVDICKDGVDSDDLEMVDRFSKLATYSVPHLRTQLLIKGIHRDSARGKKLSTMTEMIVAKGILLGEFESRGFFEGRFQRKRIDGTIGTGPSAKKVNYLLPKMRAAAEAIVTNPSKVKKSEACKLTGIPEKANAFINKDGTIIMEQPEEAWFFPAGRPYGLSCFHKNNDALIDYGRIYVSPYDFSVTFGPNNAVSHTDFVTTNGDNLNFNVRPVQGVNALEQIYFRCTLQTLANGNPVVLKQFTGKGGTFSYKLNYDPNDAHDDKQKRVFQLLCSSNLHNISLKDSITATIPVPK